MNEIDKPHAFSGLKFMREIGTNKLIDLLYNNKYSNQVQRWSILDITSWMHCEAVLFFSSEDGTETLAGGY